ncbi:MAG: prephenate dehydrogenase/arogenate dehydrogenase family protein [Nitrospirae bacterium]|nr:prephenate dehydrogenase/arogenate dehydrogenase family protein [Nitrospirota bacterium]
MLHFHRMVIVGVGLIGGSLALIAREKGAVSEIVGVGRNPENLEKAVRLGVIDRFTLRLEEAVSGADLIVLATPVGSLLRLAKEIGPHLPEGALVTDVGSVKGKWVERIDRVIPSGRFFVGGHPIAGREQSGVDAAHPQLFIGARCILTPTPHTDAGALSKVEKLWELAGAQVVRMDPEQHDRVFAAVSHLPHVVAYALVNTLQLMDREEKLIAYAAGGFKDFTRIAASHPEMWRDICLLNREPLLKAVGQYETALSRIKGYIHEGNGEALYREFAQAKEVREKL